MKTRGRILDTATTLLADRGYHDANVEEIVTRSGISKGAFYFHFPSKERMMIGLVEELAGKLVQKVERSLGDETRPERRLAIAVGTLMGTFSKRRKLARVLLINVVGHGKSLDKKVLPVRNRFAALVQRELDGAVEAGLVPPLDTKLASLVWLGAFHEVLLSWLMAEAPTPMESVIPELTAILFQSVGLPREGLLEHSLSS